MGTSSGGFRLGMIRKLVMINILVFLVFTVVLLVVLGAFHNMEGLSKTLISDKITRVIANEQLGRDLSKVLADTDLLVNTFLYGEKDVRTEGARIAFLAARLEARSDTPHLRRNLRDLTGKLGELFDQCAAVRTCSEGLDARERKLSGNLSALEETLSEKLVSRVLEGKDASILEQIGIIIPGYRETLLQITLEHVKLGLRRPGQAGGTEGKILLTLLDDLYLRLRTLTASEPEIAVFGVRMMNDVSLYRRDTVRYFAASRELERRLTAVESSRKTILEEMKTIDARISRTSGEMLQRLTAVVGASRSFILLVSAAVISLLGFFTGYFILTNIRRPMRLIRQGIESIREGRLDTRIRLNRHDEWSDIEQALNDMVADLQTSYGNLKGMNEELDGARIALQEKVLELEEQIGENKRTEAELKNSEAKWHSLYDNLPGGCFTVNNDYIIEDVNDVLCSVTGYTREELIGQRCGIICPKGPHKCPIFDMGKESIDNDETAVKAKDARLVPIIKSARRIPMSGKDVIVENFQDITDRRHLEEQLQQARKMEAVGQLAGGVAHDFNNILTAIIGYGTLLQMKIGEDDPSRRNVEQILGAAEKAAELTRSLLTLSRKRVIELNPLSLDQCVAGMEGLLSRLVREDIEFRVETVDQQLVVMGDKGQLEQILINLVTNARDSMPEGGEVMLRLERREMDDGFVEANGFGIPGKYALLTVRDTGVGMDELMRERIFEPFYTTKEMGKGTGLGLAIVYGVVQQHGGHIEVDSEPGRGSVFRVYLPEIDILPPELESSEAAELPGGTETILLAEDEKTIRDLIVSVLEKFGYTVVAAVNGEDAVEKFTRNRGRVDLLMFDVIMPKMNGKDAYNQIRKMSPEARALFISGYTGDILSTKGVREEGLNFISKPVSPGELLRKIRSMLDA